MEINNKTAKDKELNKPPVKKFQTIQQ